VVSDLAPKHPVRQNKSIIDVGTSSGKNGSWVPIPVVSTITTTQRIPNTTLPTSSVSVSLALPVSTPASTSLLGPVVSPIVATHQFHQTNSFSIPLQNVFDLIAPREVPQSMQVLEPISPVAHVDVQPVEVTKLHQKSREVWENPSVTTVTESLLDGVEHNHKSPWELGESPKDSNVHGTHSSPLGREDIRSTGVAKKSQIPREVLENPTVDEISEPLQDGVEQDHVSPRELEGSPKGAREIVARPSTVGHVEMQEVSDEILKDTFDDHDEHIEILADVTRSPNDGDVPTVTPRYPNN